MLGPSQTSIKIKTAIAPTISSDLANFEEICPKLLKRRDRDCRKIITFTIGDSVLIKKNNKSEIRSTHSEHSRHRIEEKRCECLKFHQCIPVRMSTHTRNTYSSAFLDTKSYAVVLFSARCNLGSYAVLPSMRGCNWRTIIMKKFLFMQ